MQFRLLAVGKIRESHWQEAIKEYSKRMKAYGKLWIIEIKEEPFEEPLGCKERERVLEKEAARIRQVLTPRTYCITLDRLGERVSSLAFAKKLQELSLHGVSDFSFLIGGPLGLASSLQKQAHWSLSFSDLTFPHTLMRVLFLEQLYRVSTILRGEKYHK